MAAASNTIFLLCLMTLAAAKPIMVTFGTHQGPILPPTERPKPEPRHIDIREPAPVSEQTEDVPPPDVYRAPVPHQYRNKIYEQRPQPSLVLGTPLDQKYTPTIDKIDIYRKLGRDSIGVAYTGPHIFEKQEYEVLEEKRQPPVRYIKSQYYEQKLQERQQEQKRVPQIGVVYSAGVRYYVPQLVYVDHRREEEQDQNQDQDQDHENSVYDSKDEKYLYRKEQ